MSKDSDADNALLKLLGKEEDEEPKYKLLVHYSNISQQILGRKRIQN
mgnify:FL=1